MDYTCTHALFEEIPVELALCNISSKLVAQ